MAKNNWKERYKNSCNGMLISPFIEGSYKEAYPILSNIPISDRVTDIHYDNYVRACALILDPNSPILKEFSTLEKRREYVYMFLPYLGYKAKHFEVELLKKVYRNTEWTLLCTIDNVFDEFTSRANEELANTEELDADKMLKAVQLKRKYIDDMKDMIQIREDLYKKIFVGDDELMKIEREQALTPEAIAKNRKK